MIVNDGTSTRKRIVSQSPPELQKMNGKLEPLAILGTGQIKVSSVCFVKVTAEPFNVAVPPEAPNPEPRQVLT